MDIIPPENNILTIECNAVNMKKILSPIQQTFGDRFVIHAVLNGTNNINIKVDTIIKNEEVDSVIKGLRLMALL
jgi:hypothetical protein